MSAPLPPGTKERLRCLRSEFKKLKVQALLVSDIIHVRYLSGFTGSEALLLITPRNQYLLTDSRYTSQAKMQARGFKIIETSRQATEIARFLHRRKVRKLAYEPEAISHARYLELKRAFKGIQLVRMNQALHQMRARKTPAEIRLMKKAADIALAAFNLVVPEVRPGMKEKELALALETRMRELGSEKLPFDTIVASGPRGALPHGVASERRMKKGDLVTVDFGAVYKGYQSDQTITFSLGKVSRKKRMLYELVRKAHDQAIAAIRPGVKAREVDKAARRLIAEAGYGAYFGHGLGHGVGLATHEEPVLNARSRAVLEEGMVVTVEPGIYLPGYAGVRIEDMVVVTASGARVLTASGGELRQF